MNKPRQLLDIIAVSFLPVSEDPAQLRVLRVENKLSLRQISKATGHSVSHLQQQLRKFGIDEVKRNIGIAPYGWDWTGSQLVKNANEQTVLCEIIRLRQDGKGFKPISDYLNERGITSKGGGSWWPFTVKRILLRVYKDTGARA